MAGSIFRRQIIRRHLWPKRLHSSWRHGNLWHCHDRTGPIAPQTLGNHRRFISRRFDSDLSRRCISFALLHSRISVRLFHAGNRRRGAEILRHQQRRLFAPGLNFGGLDGGDQRDVDHEWSGASHSADHHHTVFPASRPARPEPRLRRFIFGRTMAAKH